VIIPAAHGKLGIVQTVTDVEGTGFEELTKE
jgi:hypothetical protein